MHILTYWWKTLITVVSGAFATLFIHSTQYNIIPGSCYVKRCKKLEIQEARKHIM